MNKILSNIANLNNHKSQTCGRLGINEEFITKQFNKNNPFYFSHNPNSRDVIEGKYLEQEIELLKKLVKEKYGKTAEFNPTGKYWKLEW